MAGTTPYAAHLSVADLTGCDREPIHLPDAIQPHGILLGFSPGDFRICAVSANAVGFCGAEPAELLGKPLSALLDAEAFEAVAAGCPPQAEAVIRLPPLHPPAGADTALNWRASLHTSGATAVLEAEWEQPDPWRSADPFERFAAATARLQSAADVAATAQRLAEEVQSLTGYDHVMVYRFAADWNGEVIAEASNRTMADYLGLHFPASDIPAQARALYSRNAERQIPDVGYTQVRLLQDGPGPLDLSRSALRSISPLHIAYLQNMGVGAAMSVSILSPDRPSAAADRLWGMVACHHRTPHLVAPALRQASVLLAQIAAGRFALLEEAEVARHRIAIKAVETRLLQEDAGGGDYRRSLLRNRGDLLALLGAAGLVLSSGGSVTVIGTTPTGIELEELLGWLQANGPDVLASDHLAALYPPAAALPEAAGILCVRLGGGADIGADTEADRQSLLVWFRPEFARTVTWAGEPRKIAVPGASGEAVLTPRSSFAAWTEQVRGRSRPWTAFERAAASGLRDTIVDIIVRHSIDLERMNQRLVRSNEDLEAFAYVASHDLKEPLRQIETFGTLLQRAFARGSDPAEKIAGWFSGIQTSARRLRHLIDDLTEYSRVGAPARPFAPVDFGELVAEVLQDLEGRLADAAGTVEVAALPALPCDPVPMRQVIQNLLANAIKYHQPGRRLMIRVSAWPPPGEPADESGGEPVPMAGFCVADNGIGFDDRHRERIFEPFERLHSVDQYEGSGIGLAICRKVVDRHGGMITAHGRPGQGATFTVQLPLKRGPLQTVAGA